MNFGEQFKKIRTEKKLTQEDVAAQLHVSRQAVSNWENNKNLPDIEMIVAIVKTFGVSLDRLILGDNAENNITAKLIQDGSDTRRAKLNLITVVIGSLLLFMGIACILIKAFSVEYIDEAGFLHENFFLLPIAFLLIFCGILSFLIAAVASGVHRIRARRKRRKARAAEETPSI